MSRMTGIPLGNTVPFDISDLAIGQSHKIGAGAIWGFQIVPDQSARGAYPLKLRIRGPNNQGEAIIYVVSPQWFDFSKAGTPLSAVEVIAQTANPFGRWYFQPALIPGVGVMPVSPPPVPADYPAAMGGTAPAPSSVPAFASWQQFSESQALTRAAPSGASDGQSIGGASAFMTWLEAANGQTVTGGTVDIWRYANGTWQLLIQGIGVPTGQQRVGIPVDSFLLRGSGERWLVATNGVTVSGGAAVTVYQRIG